MSRKPIETVLQRILHIVSKRVQGISLKNYREFMSDEGENIAFLTNRVCKMCPAAIPTGSLILQVVHDWKLFPLEEPKMILSLRLLHMKITPVLSGYDDYKQNIHDKDMVLATRVLVAQGLAEWSFYNRAPIEVVETGLTRIDGRALRFAKNSLTPNSEAWIYFVTHVVLLATGYGEWKRPHGGTRAQWQKITTLLLECANQLEMKWRKNLEVWLEILLCLSILHQQSAMETWWISTREGFALTQHSQNLHKVYHTDLLWALLFAAQWKNRRVAFWFRSVTPHLKLWHAWSGENVGLIFYGGDDPQFILKNQSIQLIIVVHRAAARPPKMPVDYFQSLDIRKDYPAPIFNRREFSKWPDVDMRSNDFFEN